MSKQNSSHLTGSQSRGLTRRDFIRTTAVGVTATAAVSTVGLAAKVKKPAATSETLATQLYTTFTAEQKKLCAFPFDHPLRNAVNNNWRITKSRIGKSFTADQQALIREIFQQLHDPQYADKVMGQVEHDNGQEGFKGCSIALFGQPGTGKYEFVLSGRHVTRRCDGDAVEGAAFGGPIFYGHAAKSFNEPADHAGNIYWYQGLRANELFQALDGKQRKVALLGEARPEEASKTVALRGKAASLAGLPFSELTTDQQNLAWQVMTDVLAPFRKKDRDESMKYIKASGLEKLHLSYYKNHDVGNDGVWDVWQVEGPSMVWYFRGEPHVHTWVHIRQPA